MVRGMKKLKIHRFSTNLSSRHLFTIVAMVFELVITDFHWFSRVRGIGQLKTHHLSTNLSSPDATATTAAAAAAMTATRDLVNQDQLSVGFLCISIVSEDVHWLPIVWGLQRFKTFRFYTGTFQTIPFSYGCDRFPMVLPWRSIVCVWTTFLLDLMVFEWISKVCYGFPWFGDSSS